MMETERQTMKKTSKNIIRSMWMCLFTAMFFCAAGCQKQEDTAKKSEERILIGVCSYNTDFEEMQSFMEYYREYISNGMSVDFLFSETLLSGDEEREFIKNAKAKGAKGIISFYGSDIQKTLELCEEEEIYYVLGSGTISDEDFSSAENNPWFLGTIGPDTEEEYRAGYDMIEWSAGHGAKSYLLITGGAAQGNYMHVSRMKGMLDALSEKTGVKFDLSQEEIAALESVTELKTGNDISVVVSPGYLSREEGAKNLTQALQTGDYDAVACTLSIGDKLDEVISASDSWGHTALVGIVDCFSEENWDAVREKDSYGEPKLNYVAGKYASMAGPAVAAMYNAVSGNVKAVRADGKAFRLSQKLWHARSPGEYEELYGFIQGVYENAYSCDVLMQVIKVFHPDTTYEDFAKLTQASDVESVEERIRGQ